jgi:hypothetical protein
MNAFVPQHQYFEARYVDRGFHDPQPAVSADEA